MFKNENDKPDDSTQQTDNAIPEDKSSLDNFLGFFKGRKTKPKVDTQASDVTEREIPVPDEMFDTEAWRPVVRTPFLLLQVATGSKRYELENQEEKVLAASGSQTAKYFFNVHPKWVALTLFSLNLSGILAYKTMGYLADMREAELKKGKTDGTRTGLSAVKP